MLAPPIGTTGCAPLLKWPGGKRETLPRLLALVPNKFGQYHEPFLGGAALFLAIQPRKALISDSNAGLIECYCVVRDAPEDVLRLLRRMTNSKAAYLAVRASSPRDPAARAARLIYLTTLSFNGIYRENRNGAFNVPYGQKGHLDCANEERLVAVSRALAHATIRCLDFEEALLPAKNGDFVYLDPPYTVAHENNGFVKYNAKVFSWADQARLAEVVKELANKGCMVVQTNAYHASIKKLYKGFKQYRFVRASRIAADAQHRREISELIISSF
jgi:DNA adenine methylase